MHRHLHAIRSAIIKDSALAPSLAIMGKIQWFILSQVWIYSSLDQLQHMSIKIAQQEAFHRGSALHTPQAKSIFGSSQTTATVASVHAMTIRGSSASQPNAQVINQTHLQTLKPPDQIIQSEGATSIKIQHQS